MSVPLKPNAVAKLVKIYPVDPKEKEVIDSILDNLHDQSKMNFITQLIKFS